MWPYILEISVLALIGSIVFVVYCTTNDFQPRYGRMNSVSAVFHPAGTGDNMAQYASYATQSTGVPHIALFQVQVNQGHTIDVTLPVTGCKIILTNGMTAQDIDDGTMRIVHRNLDEHADPGQDAPGLAVFVCPLQRIVPYLDVMV